MLKGISPLISPELLKVLCEMGHGDTLVLADGNFPAESMGKNSRVIRCDGHGGAEMLEAILTLFPLDSYTKTPVKLMQVVSGDPVETPIWDQYEQLIQTYEGRSWESIETVERFAFYEEAKKAYAIVATGERAQYANVILQKGVL